MWSQGTTRRSCIPNNGHAQPCCTEDISLWFRNLGLGLGRKMDFQGLINLHTIPSFLISLILLGTAQKRDRRCTFFFLKKQKATLNLCSHPTIQNAVLLSLFNLWEQAHCVSFKSRYNQNWTQLLFRRTRAESALGKLGRRWSLNS